MERKSVGVAGTLLLSASLSVFAQTKPTTAPAPVNPSEVLYKQALAALTASDLATAQRTLAQMAPFADPDFGLRARFLMARVHHLNDERPEAAVQYQAVIAAGKVVKGEMPDQVIQAIFYSGVLSQEAGKLAEAQERFTRLAREFPKHALAAESQLRLGVCFVQLRQAGEAMKWLNPLHGNEKLGDLALWWTAKAQAASADLANPDSVRQTAQAAAGTMAQAIERADKTPEGKARKAEMMFDRAEFLMTARKPAEAAPLYQQLSADASDPYRAELAHEKLAVAQQLAGQYKESDETAAQFAAKYPASLLTASIMLRRGDAVYMQAVTARMKGAPAEQLKGQWEEAIRRYQAVLGKYPEFVQGDSARYGWGMCVYNLGDMEKAAEILGKVAEAQRTGELANTGYIIADCMLRTLPAGSDDALSAARLTQKLEIASKALAGFVAANETHSDAPEALVRLGTCYQLLAGLLADPAEKKAAWQAERETCEKFLGRHQKHPSAGQIVLMRATALASLGDPGAAINELNRFRGDLKDSPAAPQALAKLAEVMIAQKRPAEAADMLAKVRAAQEAAMLKDPARAKLVPALVYAHALALKESGKSGEARQLFERVAREFAQSAEAADAALRGTQCRKDEAMVKMKAAKQALAAGQAEPMPPAIAELHQLAVFFAGEARKQEAGSDLHLRNLYEAATSARGAGEGEVELARRDAGAKLIQRAAERAAKAGVQFAVAGKRADVPLAGVALQPGEKAAREHFGAVVAAGGESPVVADARLELAEMLHVRGEQDAAIKLLIAALERASSQEVGERMRIKIGNCLLAKGDLKGAAGQFQAVLGNGSSPVRAEAHFGNAETMFLAKDYGSAAGVLTRFRDVEKYRNSTMAERGLLRLGQCYAALQQWHEAKQAMEQHVSRFGGSAYAVDVFFALGTARQGLKDFEGAVNAYKEVIARTMGETAARAQMQVGLCRGEQKKWQEAMGALMTVTYAYEYPPVTAASLVEAAKVAIELKNVEEARKLLQRVQQEHGDTPWAAVAGKKLGELK